MDQHYLNLLPEGRLQKEGESSRTPHETTTNAKKRSVYRSHGATGIGIIIATERHHILKTGFIHSEHESAESTVDCQTELWSSTSCTTLGHHQPWCAS